MSLPSSDRSDTDATPHAAAVGSMLAVTGFQLRRLLSWQRLLLAALGAIFPAAVMLAVRRTARSGLDDDLAVLMLYALVPEAVCMLGLLVTMCPVVADELERGTWVHVAVRPGGRRALLLGTYLAAVTWTGAVALLASILALTIMRVPDPLRVAGIFTGLVAISTVGRAALFSLPAVIMPKRALVASVAISTLGRAALFSLPAVIMPKRALVASVAAALVVEYLAGFLPAVVNQATVSLRLRSLLVAWMGWRQRLPAEMQLLVDPQPVWVQLAAVAVLVTVLLTVAAVILEFRQFPPSDEI